MWINWEVRKLLVLNSEFVWNCNTFSSSRWLIRKTFQMNFSCLWSWNANRSTQITRMFHNSSRNTCQKSSFEGAHGGIFFLAINKIRPYEESEVLKMKTCRKAVTFRRKGRPSEDSEQADYYLDVPWNLVPFSSSLAKSGHWKRQTGNRMWGPVLLWLFDLRKVAISLCTFFVPYVDQII